ncbi:protein-L-isoaspartate O-methyltransferase, partial [Flavobacteriaceae bacterium]|nr:protein-L-isoaspartate O-methyltransferase [Flavobacteriaceae bacterium]
SGYQTAILLALGVQVYTIERQLELFKKTQIFFKKAGYRPKQHLFGDGYIGLETAAPFDGIIVTAGAPFVPKPLLEQLKIGGYLVIPVGDKEQEMTRYTRVSELKFERQTYGSFKFVPLLENKN